MATKNCLSLEDYVDFVFGIRGITLEPTQIKEEITMLVRLLAFRKPRSVLEIGTSGGGTLFLFSKVSSPDALIISLNLPTDRYGYGGYPKWRGPLYKSFAEGKQEVSLVRADSHSQDALEKVKKILHGQKLDFLFIDGDHSYKGVKSDFEMYGSLLSEKGLVAFHDVCSTSPDPNCEVHRFWCEIKNRYQHQEIIKDAKQGWAGIGVILNGPN